MKRMIVFAFLLVGLVAAEPARLRDLPEDQFRAAGLHKLSAPELDALEQLWARRDETARREANDRVAAAEARAAAAEQAEKVPDDAKSPGWLHALKTLRRVEEKPEDARALESRLAGDFKGWNGRTLFHLENGQVWQQASAGEYQDRVLKQPAVKIYPAAFGAYWMEVEGVRQRVRVKPYKLE